MGHYFLLLLLVEEHSGRARICKCWLPVTKHPPAAHACLPGGILAGGGWKGLQEAKYLSVVAMGNRGEGDGGAAGELQAAASPSQKNKQTGREETWADANPRLL